MRGQGRLQALGVALQHPLQLGEAEELIVEKEDVLLDGVAPDA
jgi:hypothetical protein